MSELDERIKKTKLSKEARDKATASPYLHIKTVYGLCRHLEGLSVSVALNDLRWPEDMTVITNDIDAIVRHGWLPVSGGSATGLSVTDAWRMAAVEDAIIFIGVALKVWSKLTTFENGPLSNSRATRPKRGQ